MKSLIILGFGGNCLDILDAIILINEQYEHDKYKVLGFLDDNAESFSGHQTLPILGKLSDASSFTDCFFVNGIGSPNNFWQKPDIVQRTRIPLHRFETIIHPKASVSRFATVGPGSVLLAGTCVGARAYIGTHVIVLQGALVSHDCKIGDFCCIASGACLSGGVIIDEAAYVGANSCVRGGLHLGAASLIGIGSVVIRDVAPRHVVVGNPAHYLRKL